MATAQDQADLGVHHFVPGAGVGRGIPHALEDTPDELTLRDEGGGGIVQSNQGHVEAQPLEEEAERALHYLAFRSFI